MFRKRRETQLELEVAFVRAVQELKAHKIGSEGYEKTLSYVTQIQKIKDSETRSSSVSKDTMAVVGANLMGILMVIKHEHVNVVTSRAMSLLINPWTRI